MNTAPRNRLFQVPKPTPVQTVYVPAEPRGSGLLTTVLIFAAIAMAAWFLFGSDSFKSKELLTPVTTTEKKPVAKPTAKPVAIGHTPAPAAPSVSLALPEFKIDIGPPPAPVTPPAEESLVAGKETSPFGSVHPSGR